MVRPLERNIEHIYMLTILAEIEVPVDDMFSPPNATPKSTMRRGGGLKSPKADDDGASTHSRPEAVARNNTRAADDNLRSSAASVRSIARSTHSAVSRVTIASRKTINTSNGRPDSKLTPGLPGKVGTMSVRSLASTNEESTSTSFSTRSTRRPVSSTPIANDAHIRVRSSVASLKSNRSQASTVRKAVAGPSTLRPPSSLSRPASNMSSTSDNSTTFETAKSDLTPTSAGRSRVLSTASTRSSVSTKSNNTVSTSKTPRSRVPSVASVASKKPPASPVDNRRLTPQPAKRTISTSSIRSAASSVSTPSPGKKVVVRKSGVPPTPPPKNQVSLPPTSDPINVMEVNPQIPLPPMISHEKQASIASTNSAVTVKGSLKRKSSSDTIRDFEGRSTESDERRGLPRGATLDIGIPCIVSSKRARFRAYARYIGEVEGEAGPWVGVEVPVNEDWADEKLDGQLWHDGSWGGIRYFDINTTAEWDYDDRTIRRRRVDWVSNGTGSLVSLKREGDQLSIDRAKRLRSVSPAVSDLSNSESRGLFVRPQQVLYVVDAVA